MNKNKVTTDKAISKLYKHIKKHGWKETMKKWKYNYIMLETPEGIIKKRIFGGIGAICGLIFALLIFLYKGLWYITIAMGFSIIIMYANLKADMKQLQILKDLKEKFGDGEPDEFRKDI